MGMMRKLLILMGILVLVGCDDSQSPPTAPKADKASVENNAPASWQNKPDRKGLEAIKSKGYIRFLLPRSDGEPGLARNGLAAEEYRRLADKFAETLGVEAKWVYVDYFDQLLPQLSQGLGDIIVTNLTVTEQRAEQVHFTLPIATVDEVLIVPVAHKELELAQMPPLTIAVPGGTSYQETVAELLKTHSQFKIEVVESNASDFDMIESVANGQIQATVVDSNIVLEFFEGLENYGAAIGPIVKPKRQIAWAVRKENTDLLTALNHFFISERIEASAYQREKRDWAKIKEYKTLRLITTNNPASYFIWRGELMGFDYDLVRKFADQHKLRLQVLVRDGLEDIWNALREGEGDLVAAAMTATDERKAMGMDFTRAYLYVVEQLISRKNEPQIESIESLQGRTIAVNPDKSYLATMQELRKKLEAKHLGNPKHAGQIRLTKAFEIVEVPGATTEELIQGVAEGRYDFTVADSHLAAIESTYRDDIKVQMDLASERPIAFAVRPDQPELKNQLNAFIKQHYRGLFYNVTYNKYFKNKKNILKNRKHRIEPNKPLSPYDDIVKEKAENFGYDWRLLTSQMYQESRFNPKAKSYAGAQGLMQVMPRTAKEFGYQDLYNPEEGIEAGVVYFNWLKDRFPEELPLEEQIYFMLAAYNAGYGHVHDARRLAKQLGKNPNKWFGNVEEAMLLLSKPEYAKKARFGYVRGREPVNYVKSIRQRYLSYLASHGTTTETAKTIQ